MPFISTHALIKRINRRLAARDEVLHRSRPFYDRSNGNGPYYHHDLGELYIVDARTSLLLRSHVDLAELGRELGVLGDGEEVANG